MSHFSVNAVRPVTAYILGVAALCLFGWVVSQGILIIPFSLDSAYTKQFALGLFALAAGLGVVTLLKNGQRSEKPWAVTRAQVNRYYGLFFIATFCAVLIAK